MPSPDEIETKAARKYQDAETMRQAGEIIDEYGNHTLAKRVLAYAEETKAHADRMSEFARTSQPNR